jgi:hypothetical protein
MRDGFDELLALFRAAFRDAGGALARDFLEADEALKPRPCLPRGLPVLQHLPRAVAAAPRDMAPLASQLARCASRLPWMQSYGPERFGPAFLDGYGWTGLFGPRGLYASSRLSGGFLLLGPGTLYPPHHHAAEELYLPLTPGTLWAEAGGDFALRPAGALIHHRSDVPHAMRTTSEPLLAAFLWRGGDLGQTPE